MIGAAVIGFTGTRLEKEALAYIPTTATTSKIVHTKPIAKDIEVVKLITSVPDVEVKIRQIAKAEGFKWPDYLVRLAHCESRLDPNAVNDKGNYPKWSKDRGLMQFNSHWQRRVSDECAFDITCATKTAIKMINNGQQHLWACDRIIAKK